MDENAQEWDATFWSVCFDVKFFGFAIVTHTKGTAWMEETEGKKTWQGQWRVFQHLWDWQPFQIATAALRRRNVKTKKKKKSKKNQISHTPAGFWSVTVGKSCKWQVVMSYSAAVKHMQHLQIFQISTQLLRAELSYWVKITRYTCAAAAASYLLDK